MSERCDVLIVGGGGAALRAAIAAYELAPQAAITLVTKGELGASGVTATSCSDRMAFHATLPSTEPGGPDAWRHHADDIYRIGGQVSDADLAEVLARNAAEAFATLDRLGVPWARHDDGRVDQFVTDGSVYARACYTGPYTANHIEAALLQRLHALPVRVLEHTLVAELLLDDAGQRVVGAALVSERDDQIRAIQAGAVVLATGGAGQVFAVNVFPPDCTGDGYAMAYRAGAELVNLEFIQIGLSSLDTKLACSGSMMRALPRLVNERDQEILPRYLSGTTAEQLATLFAKGASWPVSLEEPSHAIDIAVAAEIAAGHRVFLDYARNPERLDRGALAPSLSRWFSEAKGVDLTSPDLDTPLARLLAINRPSVEWLAERGIALRRGDRVALAPAIQHFQGGVKIRTVGETTVAGLYAAGETAGGQHGANRPGGNALLDSQVFGRLAGEAAATQNTRAQARAASLEEQAGSAVGALLRANGAPAAHVRSAVQQAMAAACGIYRTAEDLRRCLAQLTELAAQGVSQRAGSLAEAVEAANLLCVAQLIATAALRRDESRGPHLRFPEGGGLAPIPRDDAHWQRYLVLRRGQDGPVVAAREPVHPR
jgi:succinate dehydrogenase / fumarate reductase flavoprotein subunit